ncbi:MAG: GNAT family N-acetyltransferase [Acidimicrobiia bacterium]
MIEVRPPRGDDLEAYATAMSGPFGFDLPEEPDDRNALLDRMRKLFEPERARCAFDDGRIVGTLGVFSFTMTVPGGTIPVAGTTQVTVQVTHRRRGVLAQMMQAHLEEAIDHGDAAAALWASDSAIYGRFGFGMAAWNTKIDIDRRHTDFHRLASPSAAVETVDVDTIRPLAIKIYDTLRAEVPGMVGHSEAWWDRIFSDLPWSRGGAGRARYGLVTEGGVPTGWTKYRLKDVDGEDDHPSQDVIVVQLYATTPAAWAGLWQHVLSHDFGRTIRADLRPIDDPIHSLLRATRRARTRVTDGLWVRILDVASVLEARTYLTDGSVNFRVHDPLGFTTGSYRLDVTEGGGTVTRVDDANIDLDIEDLSALCLGGRSAVELAMAGRLAGPAAEVEKLDVLFRGMRAPWSPVVF